MQPDYRRQQGSWNDFKPVPDGFNQDMAHARKVLPKGEQA